MDRVKEAADLIKAQTVLLDVQPGQKLMIVLPNRTFDSPVKYQHLGEVLKSMLPVSEIVIVPVMLEHAEVMEVFKCVDEEKDLWQRLPSKASCFN